jgi:hypothetical protein
LLLPRLLRGHVRACMRPLAAPHSSAGGRITLRTGGNRNTTRETHPADPNRWPLA